MMYKMIVLDLDDTLLSDHHTISDRNKRALMKAQEMGVKVVLASGRPTFGMLPIANELDLAKYGSYLISYNGGKIVNCQTGEEIFSSNLPKEDAHQLYEISRHENVFIHTYIGDDIITDRENPYTDIEAEITGLPIKVVDNFIEAVNEPVVKVLMVDDPEKLIPIENILKPQFEDKYSIFRSKPYFLEFIKKGSTKGESLNQLIKICGIKREEIMAFGDSYNDLSMIEFAGLGVAMGNAADDIKNKADYIADSNVNDGVAKVVEELVLAQITSS